LEGVEEKVKFIVRFSYLIEPTIKVFACEDKDDNKVLEAALEVKADYIVSGDDHLLSLKEFEGIPSLEVKDFLKLVWFIFSLNFHCPDACKLL
jgi:predicted nucleic acid-binding protein